MKIYNRITWPGQAHTCVHTSRYGFSVAERNVQPFLTFPLLLNKAVAKVTEKLNSPIYYYHILLFTTLLPESAGFRVAPCVFFVPQVKKQRERTEQEKGEGWTWLSQTNKHRAASPLPPARLRLPSLATAALCLGRRGKKTSDIGFSSQ